MRGRGGETTEYDFAGAVGGMRERRGLACRTLRGVGTEW